MDQEERGGNDARIAAQIGEIVSVFVCCCCFAPTCSPKSDVCLQMIAETVAVSGFPVW